MAPSTGSAAAQCVRHFYNNSDETFYFSFNGKCNGRPGLCSIRPHDTSGLSYADGGGTVLVKSTFYKQTFFISSMPFFGSTGCYIQHSGNTGAIAVNDPADGDITTCGTAGWLCPAIR